jgi:hypothetical protein
VFRNVQLPRRLLIRKSHGRQKIKFILLPEYSSNKHWKEQFFFVQGVWECPTTETVADPEVPRKVRRLLSSKQDEPILTEDEATHVRVLLKYSEEHVAKMDFDAVFSQSALAARLRYPPTASVAESRALTKSKLKRKRKAAVLQISESQPTEITRLEAPILSSDKSSSGVNVREKSSFSQEETSEQDTGPGTPASSKKQKGIPETQGGETLQSSELDRVKASLTDQLSVETQQGEIRPPLRTGIVQHSLTEPSLTAAIVSSPSLGSHIPLAEDVAIGEFPTRPLTVPSPVNLAYLSGKTREEKGKDAARDDMSDDPAIERLEANLSSDSIIDRAEDGTQRDFSRGETVDDQLGGIAKTRSDEMPEGVRAKFLSSLFKSKMFTRKGQTTASNPSDTKLLEKPMTCEERGTGIITVEG